MRPRTQEEIDAEDLRWRAQARAERIETRCAAIRDFYGHLADTDWNHPSMVRNAAQVQTVRSWTMGSCGLLLPGDTGGGKSRCMCALLLRLAGEGVTDISLWKAQHLFAYIGEQFKFGVDQARETVAMLAARKILVVEDLGQEGMASSREDAARQWFFDILDERYMHGRPLFVTTNLTDVEIAGVETRRAVTADPMIRRLKLIAAPVLPRFERAGARKS